MSTVGLGVAVIIAVNIAVKRILVLLSNVSYIRGIVALHIPAGTISKTCRLSAVTIKLAHHVNVKIGIQPLNQLS